MHTNDRQAGENAGAQVESSPQHHTLDVDLSEVKGEGQPNHRKYAGEKGIAWTVGYLDRCVAIAEND